MAQGFVKLTGGPIPFAYRHPGTTFARIEANTDLRLVWDDGTVEIVRQGTTPVTQSGGSSSFDALTKTWMVVFRKGNPNQPTLVEEKDYLLLATSIYSSATWAVVYRATQTLEQWQQS